MGRRRVALHWLGIAFVGVACLGAPERGGADADLPPQPPKTWTLHARVVATGLPRANGIRMVGRFHTGGPLTTNPEFLMQTQAGRVLDPQRVLVALEHNLGASRGNAGHAPGTVLSIDPQRASDGRPLAVPVNLALLPRATPGAAVQIYSAQSEPYLNRRHNSGSRTAGFTAAAGPRYLSINNAFGRPWIANAPFGLRGDGSESVVDPDGAPLANAPSDAAGGVFVGAATPRETVPKQVRTGFFASLWNGQPSAQLTPGAIGRGAFGTALLGPSPDGSGFAVFAVVTGEGAIVQAHVQDGVDGLAPPGTIAVGADDPGLIGIAFKWNPQRVLYLADAQRDRIVLAHLSDDTRHFTLDHLSHIGSPWLRRPIDLAAAIPEVANPRFASHTTLAGGSDLYVVNRGDGSLLRIDQHGRVLARAEIEIAGQGRIGADRLRSIAVSADAQRLFVIAQQPGSEPGGEPGSGSSLMIELSGFDGAGPFAAPAAPGALAADAGRAASGAQIFRTEFTPRTGLGPRFNASSCLACHPGPGGSSAQEIHFARRVARVDPVSGRAVPIDGHGSLTAARFSAGEPGELGVPREANVVSLRMPSALFGIGRIDDIPDAVIEAQAVGKGDGIKGHVNRVVAADGTRRVGRYGWKADIANLDDMVAEAFANEMGIHSVLALHPQAPIEDDGTLVRQVAAFLRDLARPTETAR
jgi:Di-haem oxidoreductase, putative peroxidase